MTSPLASRWKFVDVGKAEVRSSYVQPRRRHLDDGNRRDMAQKLRHG